ncbi:MAG: GHKL domain-containing protein [Propioniciclava sp.]
MDGALPDIPRFLTGIAEWGAVMVYVWLIGGRFGLRRSAALSIVGLLTLVGTQLLAGLLPLELWTLGMVVAVAAMFGIIWLIGKVSAREAGDLTARAFVLAELVASLHWQLHVFFFPHGDSTLAPTALWIVLYAGAFGLAYVIERPHFPQSHRIEVDNRALVSVIGIAAVTFLMSNLSFINTANPFSGRVSQEVFYIRTLVDLAGYVVIFALRGQQLAFQRAAQAQAAMWMLENQQAHYLQSKHDIDAVNRKYHDLKHYVHAIRAEQDPEARAGYVDQLEDEIRGYERSMIDTGSPVLDAIVTAKQDTCDRLGISLMCLADGEAVSFLDPMDIVALVGNALDNAIDAVSQFPDEEQRRIRLMISRKGAFTVLTVENPFAGEIDTVDGLPRTTKRSSTHHGYGMRNMRDIAERHGGNLRVNTTGDSFVLHVLLPTPRH